MLKKLKIILIAGVSAVIVLDVGLAVWWKAKGAAWAQKSLSAKWGWDVDFKQPAANFLFRYSLNDVVVRSPLAVRIASLSFGLKPWTLVMTVKGAHIVYDLSAPLKFETQSDVSSLLSRFQLHVKKSSLTVVDGQDSLSLSYIGGAFKSSGATMRAAFLDQDPKKGVVEILFNMNLPAGEWQAEINLKNRDISQESRILMSRAHIDGDMAGAIDAGIHLSSKNPWKARVSMKSLSWRQAEGLKPLTIKGAISGDSTGLTLDSVMVNETLAINGRVLPEWSDPRLELNIRGPRVDALALLGAFVNIQDFNIGAHLQVDATLRGTLKNPSVQASFSSDIKWRKYQFPSMQGELVYRDDILTLESQFSGGQVRLSSRRDPRQQLQYVLEINGVSLSEWAQAADWPNVAGRLHSRLVVTNLPSDPQAKGRFQIDDFSWARLAMVSTMSGHVDLSRTHVAIVTFDEAFVFNGTRDKNSLSIDHVEMNLAGGSSLWAQGFWDIDSGRYRLLFRGANIPPDLWPPLVAHYPQISGQLNFDGTLNRENIVHEAQGYVSFKDLKFMPESPSWEGAAVIDVNEQEISLSDIRLTGGYSGHVSKKLKSADKAWVIDISMKNADPRLLADMAQSRLEIGGFLNGLARVRYENAAFIGVSSITWQDVRFADVAFEKFEADIELEKDAIIFSNVNLIDHEEAFRAQGRLFKKGANWAFDIEAQTQQWGTSFFRMNGELAASGVYNPHLKRLNGNISSHEFNLNDYALEDFSGVFRWQNKRFYWSAQAGEFLKTTGWYDQTSSLHNAGFQATSLPLDHALTHLFPFLGWKVPPRGRLTLDIATRGAWNDFTSSAVAEISNGFWRDENFSARAQLSLSSDTIHIVSSTVSFKTGGHVAATGVLTPGKRMSVSGSGRQLAIDTVFNWLNWPLSWPGRADAEFDIGESWDDPKIAVSFDAVHQGLGPFQENGRLKGKTVGRGREWDLSGIEATFGGGFVRALDGSRVFITDNNSGRIRVLSDIRNLRSGPLNFFGQTELTGVWGEDNLFDTKRENFVDFDVYARPLWINQFLLNGSITHMALKKGAIEFSPIAGSNQQVFGTLDYSSFPSMSLSGLTLQENGQERLFVDGAIGRDRWDFTARASGVDAAVVRGLLDTTYPVSGPLDFLLDVGGDVENPIVKGVLTLNNGHVGPVPVDQASVTLALEKGIFSLTDFRARRKNGYEIDGWLSWGTDLTPQSRQFQPVFDIRLTRGDFRLLTSVFDAVNMGRGGFEGRLTSTMENDTPVLEGYIEAKDLYVKTDAHVPSLRSPRVRVDLNRNVMTLSTATLRLGRGIAEAWGYAQFSGLEAEEYDFYLKSISPRGLSVKVPELSLQPGALLGRFAVFRSKLSGSSKGEAHVDLRCHLNEEEADWPILSGRVMLENAVFTYPPPPALSRGGRSQLKNYFTQELFYDVHLIAGDRTRYENDLVDARVNGSMHFYGLASDLIVNGRIVADQGGIVYSGNEFKLNEAVLEIETSTRGIVQALATPTNTFVYLKARAEKNVFYTDGSGNANQDTITMLLDRSLIGEIQPRFVSKNNPAMPSERALQLALGFRVQDPQSDNPLLVTQPAAEQRSQEDLDHLLRSGLVQLVDSSLASPLARALARQTGLVDFIRITYQPDAGANDPVDPADLTGGADPASTAGQSQMLRYVKGTRVKVGREVSNRLFADYSVKLDEYKNQLDFRHEVELAYRLRKSLFIRAISELDSQRTLGREPDRRALLENQWRFGLPRRKPQEAEASNITKDQ